MQLGLSGTPAEAGVRVGADFDWFCRRRVSVEPLPKQGCEGTENPTIVIEQWGLSGTPAEAGVRVYLPLPRQGAEHCLSGTPAEAGVRAFLAIAVYGGDRKSQWNPCRSRGARGYE